MALNLGNIFGKKTIDNNQKQGSTSGVTIKGVTSSGDLIIASKVDWKKEGVKDAGSAKGDINAFSAGFESCYAKIKKSQELDQELQDKMKQELQNEIINLETEKNTNQTKLQVEESSLSSLDSDIQEKQDEIARIKTDGVRKDKSIIVNCVIGAVILLFMTMYLFLFYSSTGYSAFFRNFGTNTSIQTAMFYGQSIPQAFKEGLFEGLFIVFLPVIFLGLGFVVHQFGTTTKGFSRYVKTISLYALTFAFDFLLAYKISKEIYEIRAIYEGLPPFSLKIAFVDMDFWIVIFCGFVSYVIWGLVFSFVMQNYDRLTDIKHILQNLQSTLRSLQQKRADVQNVVMKLRNTISSIEGKIKQKNHEITNCVRYDFKSMEQYLTDYYQGWISYLALCSANTDTFAKMYDDKMKTVHNWMNEIRIRNKKIQEE